MAYVPNSGSVVVFQSDPNNLQASVRGNVGITGSVFAIASIAGVVQTNNASVITVNQGSIATVIIGGSIAASFTPPANQSVSGRVETTQTGTVITSLVSTIPSSVLVGASIIGLTPVSISNFPTTQNVSGSIAAFVVGNASLIKVGQGSIATVIIGGSIAASFTPPANQSVSGAVSVSNFPTTQNVSGSIATFIVGNASVITVNQGSIAAVIIGGSIAASFTPPANQSVSGRVETTQTGTVITSLVSTIPSSVLVGASIIGLTPVSISNFPTTQNVSGSVATFQAGTWITSIVNTVPSSVIVGASIFGQLPAGSAVIGSIAVLQGTTPWLISSIYGNISGSVAATITNTNLNVSGSVVTFQGTSPWVVQSIVGTYAEDIGHASLDKGLFILGVRNDTIASLTSADMDYGPQATDSAGRSLTKPFTPEEATFRYVGSIVSGSVTLIAASAIGKRQYITDFRFFNTGSVATLITFLDGSTSIVGYTGAPAGGGSNWPGVAVPERTNPSQDLAFKMTTMTSVLYATINGFTAP